MIKNLKQNIFNGKVLATGIGSRKKSAEMEAAKKALGE